MSQDTYLFIPKNAENNNTLHYLGSDGLPIERTYNLYLNKCDEFKARAKQYAKHNLYLKESILHHNKVGYEKSERLEEEIILEREEHLKEYKKAFNITSFDEDPNSMYECFTGKSKKIRIIRELHEMRNDEFSDDFENKRATWFTRYCILSRFIQIVRKVILINRLQKSLTLLRPVISEMKNMCQDEAVKNGEVEEKQTLSKWKCCS